MVRKIEKIPKTWENVRKLILTEKKQQEFIYKIIKILFFVAYVILGLLATTFMFFSLTQDGSQGVLTSSIYIFGYVATMTLLIGLNIFVYPRIYLLDQLELFSIHRDYEALIKVLKKRLSDSIITLYLVVYVLVLEYVGITILRMYASGVTYTYLFNTTIEVLVTTHIILIIFGIILVVFYKMWGTRLIVTQINRYLNIVHWSGGNIEITDTNTYPEV